MSIAIEAVRAFWFDGHIVEPGQRIFAPVIEASELLHSNKAVLVQEAPPVEEPETKNPKAKAKAEADE